MNAKTLLEWAKKYNAKNRTIEGFWQCFNKWRIEEKYEYLDTFYGKLYDEFISVEENQMYLKLRFGMEEAFIFYTVDIFYLENHIGTYDIEFFLNGEIADEYLDFDSFDCEIKEIKRNLTIARKAFKEHVELKAISNITGIKEDSLKIIKRKYS